MTVAVLLGTFFDAASPTGAVVITAKVPRARSARNARRRRLQREAAFLIAGLGIGVLGVGQIPEAGEASRPDRTEPISAAVVTGIRRRPASHGMSGEGGLRCEPNHSALEKGVAGKPRFSSSCWLP